MADKQLSTVREALMAELLIDVDRLLNKVSDLDQSLSDTIEKSTEAAASKAFLSTTLQLKRLAEDVEMTIDQASVRATKSLALSHNLSNQQNSKRSNVSLSFPYLLALCYTCSLFGFVGGICLVILMEGHFP